MDFGDVDVRTGGLDVLVDVGVFVIVRVGGFAVVVAVCVCVAVCVTIIVLPVAVGAIALIAVGATIARPITMRASRTAIAGSTTTRWKAYQRIVPHRVLVSCQFDMTSR